MAKIFQLELFIKEMSIWKLPHLSEDCDETCVEVTVFDIENVPINGYVFGKNSTMNRGQNFLFTLNAMPENNKVFFNVFKKAYNREKNFLGSGKIPIEKIFDDVFSQTFNGTKRKQKTSNQESTAATNKIAADEKAAGATNMTAFDPNQPSESADLTSTTQETENATSVTTKKSVTSTTPSTTDATAKNAVAGSSSKPSTPGAGATNADPSPATAVPDTTADSTTVESASEKKVQVNHATNSVPISRLTKDVYPIIGCDSQQWGTVCILMRLTSFGNFTAHPIHIHQSHNEIILQNTPNTAMYKFVPLDDLMQNKRNVLGSSKFKHRPIEHCTDIASSRSHAYNKRTTNIDSTNSSATKIASNYCSSCTSSSGTKVALNATSTSSSDSDEDLCPAPPGSPRNDNGQYEEFKVEVNDNVLCVRMPKNAGVVRRIYDKNDSTEVTCYLDNGQSAYSEHIKRIPIIRGNRKYPAHYGVLTSFPSSCTQNNLIYDEIPKAKDFSLQCNENRIRQDDSMSCPSDVQIVRKSDDPKRDVFVLKIGKDRNDGIQLEMKTPKNPLARRATNNQTTSSQTYDDEFVSESKTGGKKGGRKGGKKK